MCFCSWSNTNRGDRGPAVWPSHSRTAVLLFYPLFHEGLWLQLFIYGIELCFCWFLRVLVHPVMNQYCAIVPVVICSSKSLETVCITSCEHSCRYSTVAQPWQISVFLRLCVKIILHPELILVSVLNMKQDM